MEYGKLTKVELLEVESIGNRLIAIDNLIQRLLSEQEEYDMKKETTFAALRKKYDVPEGASIIIENGKIVKFEQ